MLWELQQGPIRFEGHKQVGEFLFYSCLMDRHQTWNKKTMVEFICSVLCAETGNMRVISGTALPWMPPSLSNQMMGF